MLWDFAALDAEARGKLLRACVVPRPIAWVTTLHADGRRNAAPFSFFNLLCAEPPLLGFGITPRAGAGKDTGANIRRSGEFVVNLVPHALAAAMNETSAEHGPEVDELAAVGLAAAPSLRVAPPRILGCPAALECRLHTLLEPGGAALVVIGEVLAMHVEDHAVLDAARHYLDVPAMGLVARMHGRGWYARTTDLFELGRPATNKETP